MLLNFNDPAKLKTKKVVFEEIYVSRDSGTLEQLKELSTRRRAIEESINESSFMTEAIAREMAGGLTSQYQQDLQKLEKYLPLLENLVFHVDLVGNNHQMVRYTSDLKIRWSSSLLASSLFNFMVPKFFRIDDLRFELGMSLFLYGAILREWASEVLPTDLVQSATLYRKAAGIYHYLAHQVLPSLQHALAQERPPEATSSVSSIMSLICLAEAQAVTIKKAEEKGSRVGLLAKLHYGIVQLLDEAIFILNSKKEECKDISVRFVDFISSSRALHELRSQTHLAEDLKGVGQVGVALGVLRRALGIAKSKIPVEESRHVIFMKEIDGVGEFLRKLEYENEFVWHEKIPNEDELPSPQGNKIVTVLPYNPQRWERELVFKI